jgi:hypothetical protein
MEELYILRVELSISRKFSISKLFMLASMILNSESPDI